MANKKSALLFSSFLSHSIHRMIRGPNEKLQIYKLQSRMKCEKYYVRKADLRELFKDNSYYATSN
jgi:hypothetical protein